MRKFKFKSLTMRIWMTFTAVILLVALCLTVMYFYYFRYLDTRGRTQDLLEVHDILLDSNFADPARFDILRNMRGASHFIHSNGHVNDFGMPPMRGQPGRMPPPNIENPMPQYNDFAVRNWILNYIGGSADERTFNKRFDGVNFIFAITEIGEGVHFVTYMPNVYDNSLMYYMLVISGLFILVGFAAARIIAKYISKPLSRLENFTMRIAAKDWKEPIVLKNEDEIGRLAVSMNKMQEALKRADEEEKTFLQSISHDLKTPVMVIMGHADAIIDGVYIDTLDKTAQIIKDEALRLNKRIKQLLYLNTLDYILGSQTETDVIELGKLVRSTVDKLEILGSSLDWKLDIVPVAVKGSEEKLTVAIENILDNALRYAKSEIRVTLNKTGNSARIEVFNDGDKIKPEDLGDVFRSLYKGKTGNFGLGLAISKRIITFFGGNVYAENRENGVSFIIDYPA